MTVLSAIVIAKDEEPRLAACLRSLAFADRLVVIVDSASADRTREIAQAYTPHVFVEPWRGYAGTKQLALDRTTGDWVFWLDADERATPELAEEIRRVTASPSACAAYRIRRRAFFLGRWIRHGGWYPGFVVRLFRKSLGRFNGLRVHESLEIDGPIGTLEAPILHYTDDTLEHYLHKFNTYTGLAAQELSEKAKPFRRADLLFRPLSMFFKMFIFRLGFLDGMEGFVLAVLSANYVFTKYAKRWELEQLRKPSAA